MNLEYIDLNDVPVWLGNNIRERLIKFFQLLNKGIVLINK